MPAPVQAKPKAPSDPSTRGRYLGALSRDTTRTQKGTIGNSANAFEVHARQARKNWRASAKTLTPMKTPYGQVNLSKFPTSDPAPKITTVKKNYKGASIGHKYTELTDALVSPTLPASRKRAREQEVAGELLESIKDNKPPPAKRSKIAEGAEANAAAKLLTISHVSEPERVGGSSKDFRRVLRKVKKGNASFQQAFVGDATTPPLFGMAKDPTTTRRALGIGKFKNPHPPASFVALDSDYSDDSDG